MIALSAREMHIYVEQGLQRQGAYKKDKQFDQAVDIALTQAQSRIIKAKLIPDPSAPDKFEINAKYTSDIESLIVLNYPLFVYKDPDHQIVHAQLPHDFGYLLGDASYVVEDCQEAFTSPDPSATIVERTIQVPFANATTAPYFKSIIVSTNTDSTTITTSGFATTEERVYLVDNIIEIFNKADGVEAYWEKYKDTYVPNTFLIIVRDNFITTQVKLIVDSITAVNKFTDVNIDTYIDFEDDDERRVVNRDSKADYRFNMLGNNSYYYQPTPDSPICIMNQGQLSIMQSKRFLVSRVFVDYIRKPKRIVLSLNQSSELSETTHDEIVDMAIRLLKKKIADETYDNEVRDTVRRVE